MGTEIRNGSTPEDDATTDINRAVRINANANVRNLALAA